MESNLTTPTPTPLLVDAWPTAGRMLGLGRTKTLELIRRGDLPRVRIDRRVLIPVQDIHEYVARLRSTAGIAEVA